MASLRMDRVNDLEHLLQELEARLTRLSRIAARATATAPETAGRFGDSIAAALSTMADRFRGRAATAGSDVSHFSDEALQLGNDALRKLTREVEQRPLTLLAVAIGVGVLAAGLLARRG
jgi:ElaB/YqjD/DUF883 family membrane-anchored ribosome-binding protein